MESPVDGWVLIAHGSFGESRHPLLAGKKSHSIYLPDLRQAAQVEFTVVDTTGSQLVQQTMLWQPGCAGGGLWPIVAQPDFQAHHGATSPDFGAPYLRDPAAFQPGHLYACLSVSNFRTNFQPVQAGDMVFRFSLTSSVGGEGQVGAALDFGWAVCMPLPGFVL